MPTLKMIWAQGPNGELGLGNKLPWSKIEEDLMFFKNIIHNNWLIMGSKTYYNIPLSVIADKKCIVLSRCTAPRGPSAYRADTIFVDSVEAALRAARGREATVIGGRQIYDLFMSHADMLLVSNIEIGDLEADVYAPVLSDRYATVAELALSGRVVVKYYAAKSSRSK